jgi:hypothetical protein
MHAFIRQSGSAAIALTALLAAGHAADASEDRLNAYACTRDGVTTFSDQPCSDDAEPVTIEYSAPAPAERAAAEERLDAQIDEADALGSKLALEREIARVEGRISDLQKQRDAELRVLRASLAGSDSEAAQLVMGENAAEIVEALANTDVAEAARAVNQRYTADIAVEQQRLDVLLRREAQMTSEALLPQPARP